MPARNGFPGGGTRYARKKSREIFSRNEQNDRFAGRGREEGGGRERGNTGDIEVTFRLTEQRVPADAEECLFYIVRVKLFSFAKLQSHAWANRVFQFHARVLLSASAFGN